MRSRLLILLPVAAGVAVVWLLIQLSNQQQQSRQDIEALRAELTALKASLQRQSSSRDASANDNRAFLEAMTSLQKTAAAQRAAQEQRPPDAEAEATEAPRGPKRPPPMTYEQSQAMVLTAYSKEAPDSAWSRDAEKKLDATIRSHLPSGSRLSSLECRSTMCQVEIVHRDPKVGQLFLMEGFHGWPGSIFVAGEKEAHGELVVTIIAAREGTEPPMGPR